MTRVKTEWAAAAADSLPSTPERPSPPVSGQPVSPVPLPTRAEWSAAGLSLVLHLVMMLVLAAVLMPLKGLGTGTSLDSGLGNEQGDGELVDSISIGSPDGGKGEDLEKSVAAGADAVPALEGALAGSGAGSGGKGRFDAAAALGAGGSGTGKGVGFFGTRARADSVVFVVDMSGSMADEGRFERAIDELIKSINLLQPSQRFFVFFYNNLTHPMLEQRTAKLLAATPGNRTKAIKWIHSLRPDGDTFPDEAIERALKLKPQVIYFLTDGEIPNTVRKTAKRFNSDQKTVIHTIAFVYEGGAEMLRGIAIDNRGKYRFVR
jgi:hypothetical protein